MPGTVVYIPVRMVHKAMKGSIQEYSTKFEITREPGPCSRNQVIMSAKSTQSPYQPTNWIITQARSHDPFPTAHRPSNTSRDLPLHHATPLPVRGGTPCARGVASRWRGVQSLTTAALPALPFSLSRYSIHRLLFPAAQLEIVNPKCGRYLVTISCVLWQLYTAAQLTRSEPDPPEPWGLHFILSSVPGGETGDGSPFLAPELRRHGGVAAMIPGDIGGREAMIPGEIRGRGYDPWGLISKMNPCSLASVTASRPRKKCWIAMRNGRTWSINL